MASWWHRVAEHEQAGSLFHKRVCDVVGRAPNPPFRVAALCLAFLVGGELSRNHGCDEICGYLRDLRAGPLAPTSCATRQLETQRTRRSTKEPRRFFLIHRSVPELARHSRSDGARVNDAVLCGTLVDLCVLRVSKGCAGSHSHRHYHRICPRRSPTVFVRRRRRPSTASGFLFPGRL